MIFPKVYNEALNDGESFDINAVELESINATYALRAVMDYTNYQSKY